jgi:poly(A) polymerase/tRNA nucleotidyltransferase (CCA-adding enzyme)
MAADREPAAEGPRRRIPPPAFLAEPALRAVLAALPEARMVGGAVRDALAGRSVADVDLATPMRPEQVMQALGKAGLKAVPTGLAHGTVTAVAGHRGFEVTTLRRDVETDGRHAVVAYTDSWREDAARRDFTINAMSMGRDGAVYDYFGGLEDLSAGLVRFVGEPSKRIAEDHLRILRFFRFHARYGRGWPDPAALAAIRGGVGGLAQLSVERIWSEFKRILAAPNPAEAFGLMQESGVLAAVLPEGAAPGRLGRLLEAGAPAEPLLRLAALLEGDAAALAERWRLASAEADRLIALRSGSVPADDADDATLRRALADTPADILEGRAWLAGRGAALRARLIAMPRPVFPLQGRHLRAAGVPPGPGLGALMRRLRQWWMDGGCVADAAACQAELARMLAG